MATITLAQAAINAYNPYVVLTVTESATSATANTSTLSYSLVLYRPSTVSSSASKAYSFSINGISYSGTTTIGGSGTATIKSGTQTVSHDSDGTKSISISASFTFGLTWSGTSMGTYTRSTTMTLTSLDRTAPTISISSSSSTNNTITIAATSSVSCNTWQYSTNGGSSYTTFNSGSATSVSTTIGSLSANTTYSIVIRAYKVANNVAGTASKSVTTLGASTITSASSVTMGNACAVKFTPLSTSFYYTLAFTFGGNTVTTSRFCPGTTSAYTYTGYTFAVATWAPYCTSATSGTCTVVLTTYASSSGSQVGSTSSATFTLTVPTSVVPSFSSLTVAEGNSSLPSAFSGYFVQGLSTFKATAVASGSYSSTIKSIVITMNGASYTTSGSSTSLTATSTSGSLSSYGTLTISATVTDSRGRTATTSTTKTVVRYYSPTITGLNLSFSGAAVTMTAAGAVAPVNSLNSYSYTLTAYKSSDESDTQTITGTDAAAGSYSIANTLTLEDVETETYTITFTITDTASNTATLTKQTGTICFSRLAGGNGAAFFKEADTEGVVDINGGLVVEGTDIQLGPNTIGGSLNPVFLYGGVPTACSTVSSGKYYSGIPSIGSDSVIELGQYIDLHTKTSTANYDVRLTTSSGLLRITGAFAPNTSGGYTLGTSSYLWSTIYSNTSTISTSDEREKTDITDLDSDQAAELIADIRPVTYKLKKGDSGRLHWGMVAQDIEKTLEKMGIPSTDFAGFIKTPVDNDGNEVSADEATDYIYGLRYEEFIAPLIKTIQKMQAEIDSLKALIGG